MVIAVLNFFLNPNLSYDYTKRGVVNKMDYTGKEITTEVNNNKLVGYEKLQTQFSNALVAVDDIVLKNYLSKIDNLSVVPLDDESKKKTLKSLRLFKVTEMVYEKDEFSAYKFASVFNSLANVNCTVYIIIDSNGQKTDFYVGIRGYDEERTPTTIKDTLKKALCGQFPGVKINDNYLIEDMENLFVDIQQDKLNISSVSCVANSKDDEIDSNDSFVQGLEKLVTAMQGEKYTGIIIADAATKKIQNIKRSYENIYSQLIPFAKTQIAYSKSDAFSKSVATCIGSSLTHTHSEGVNESTGYTHTVGTSESSSETESHSESKQNLMSKILKATPAVASIVSGALAPVTGGASLAVGAMVSGAAGFAGMAVEKTETGGTSTTYTTGRSTSDSTTRTHGTSSSDAESRGQNESETNTEGTTESTGRTLTLTVENKTITDIVQKLEKQLKRIEDCESLGMWECAAYFMSKDNDVAEIAALTYKSLMRGENSGVEAGAVNSWFSSNKEKVNLIKEYLFNIRQPVFEYNLNGQQLYLTAASMVSSNELAIHMGLPRKSVPGFPVIEHADFGKEVVSYNHSEKQKTIKLGTVFNMGAETKNEVELNLQSLSMHTFITGATGSGKSNTVYQILGQLLKNKVNFMVIEPAKGEYKNIFGNTPFKDLNDVHIFGTNPQFTDLLKINPFKFPKGVHVLEHVDRLIEIFNVCWPMYAAMPAVLKDAVLQAYENAGWNLLTSENKISEELFPSFKDLLVELVDVINKSAYDQEVKSNYIGSLQTRVKSLTNGLNGQIFSSNEIDNSILFDSNVVVDLSRIGSLETKALIMGILVMRLNEHRMTQTDGMNVPLKHVTVLEEAHNILKRTSTEQSMEGANMAGKSVEMLSNAIAEMRTYGEGFIIADQSPNAVDVSAIRNTNTKIIMRLPDEDDRMLAGKAAALKDEQIDEIAKLPKGVAVVYQNDWLEAVLCKVDRFNGEEKLYQYNPENTAAVSDDKVKHDLIKFFINDKKAERSDKDVERLKAALISSTLTTLQKKLVYPLINKNVDEKESAKAVVELLECKDKVEKAIATSKSLEEINKCLFEIVTSEVSIMDNCEVLDVSKNIMRNYFLSEPELELCYKYWIEEVYTRGRLL